MNYIANTFDTFGRVLQKSSHSIHPDVCKVADSTMGDESPNTYSDKTQSCYDSVQEMAIISKRLADYYRSHLVARLQTILSDNRNVLEIHGQRYVAARTQCMETRKRALTARSKYLRSLRAAEKTFGIWKVARTAAIETGQIKITTPTPTESSEWEKSIREYGKTIPNETDRLVKKLHEVEAAKVRYEELVEVENDAVAYAEKMEMAALDALQGVETKRIHFFFNGIVIPLGEAADKDKLKTFATTTFGSVDPKQSAEETTSLDLKKGKDLLANIFIRQTISYEEGMGRTDAETLGLPLSSGQLRDDVKKQVSAMATWIKAAQIIAEFLETFVAAIATFETGLKADSLNTNSKQELGGVMTVDTIGPNAAEMWKNVMKIHQDQAIVAEEVASTLTTLRLQKLEGFLESAQRELKSEKDFDDSNWKTLCEVARTESKAAARYRHVRAQQEKARERMQSVDVTGGDDAGGQVATTQKGRVSKALFAGGEAMKKFQENARFAIAKSNLNEADQIAAKEQHILDEATATKSYAIADYKRVTETRILKLEAINNQVKSDLEHIMEAIILAIERLEQARVDTLRRLLDDGVSITVGTLMQDVEEWVQLAKDRIEANRKLALIDEEERPNKGSDWGYRLSVDSCQSEPVMNILNLTGSTTPPPEFITKIDDSVGAESSEDEHDLQGIDSSFESNGSAHSSKRYSLGGSIHVPTGNEMNGKLASIVDTEVITEETISNAVISSSSLTPRAVFEHVESNMEESSTPNVQTHKSHDIQVFIRQFWHDTADKPPEIFRIVSCAYRPKEKAGFLIPTLHGRLYTTADKLYFLALDGKSFVLSWDDVVSVGKEKGFMGAGDNAVTVTYKTSDMESTFVLSRLEGRDSVLSHLEELMHQSNVPHVTTLEDNKEVSSVPPDALLKTMTNVLSKTLRGVSITEIYEKAWSEGNGTSEKPFYGPWLEEEECFDITVEDWEFATPGSQGFVGPWCKEQYTQRRLATFKFKRTSHLYMGPPVAAVKQMHYCRLEGNDKCIVAISATFEGIPYSDAFAVEMRWVARRLGSNDLDIQVGLEVDFKKSSMLKSQIKAGTIAETKNVHLRMFDAMKRVCSSKLDSDDVSVSDSVTEVAEREGDLVKASEGLLARWRQRLTLIPVNPNFLLFAAATLSYPVIWNFFSTLLGAPAISINEARRLNMQIKELRLEVNELRKSIDIALDALKNAR